MAGKKKLVIPRNLSLATLALLLRKVEGAHYFRGILLFKNNSLQSCLGKNPKATF